MKNALTATAAVFLAAATLAACSDPGAGTTTAAPSGSSACPSPTASLKGTNLTIWAAQNSTDVPKPVIAGFEKATGATVNVVTIPDPYEQGVQTKVATGDKPDLAFWQPTASQLSVLQAKTNLQSLDGAPWADNYTGDLSTATGILDKTRYAALVTT